MKQPVQPRKPERPYWLESYWVDKGEQIYQVINNYDDDDDDWDDDYDHTPKIKEVSSLEEDFRVSEEGSCCVTMENFRRFAERNHIDPETVVLMYDGSRGEVSFEGHRKRTKEELAEAEAVFQVAMQKYDEEMVYYLVELAKFEQRVAENNLRDLELQLEAARKRLSK